MSTDPYGLRRVVDEPGTLPQQARRLDPSLPIGPDELLVDLESLNVDAASFAQFSSSAGRDPARIGEAILSVVRERGKLQNPVTGSGGMLLGRVREIGLEHPARGHLREGDRIATLVSLTLTPLSIERILRVDLSADRVDAQGHAILFASGLYARLPADLPDRLCLAALDVCGAPALIARHVRPGMRVLVIGSGKSGALCLAQARRQLGGAGQLLALDISAEALEPLRALGLADAALAVDARRPLAVLERVEAATGGALCDLVVSCASVGGTEMAAILSARAGGTVLFFSMATRFTAAALGAEGVGKDVTLLIGNGYVPGHADLTLELLRADAGLRELFERKYL